MGNTWAMPWMTRSLIETRAEFIQLASLAEANMAELCRRFKVSRKTAYKRLDRFTRNGEKGLKDRSRRPKHSPGRTDAEVAKKVLELRAEHPAWGPRKLKRRLEDLGQSGLPAHSTFGAILRREGAIAAGEASKHQPWQRFERQAPNQLWQMDFKGDFALSRGGRCYPLPIIDDHSRYLVGIFACGNQTEKTVRGHLQSVFERYGLPEQILCDNGSPWSGGGEWTGLTVWLLRHGIKVLHGRPFHPQTQGKEERLNRTLKAEVLLRQDLRDLEHTQQALDQWRTIYNTERPHEALGMEVPLKRYRPSLRSYNPQLGEIQYAAQDEIRKVKSKGEITWRNRTYFIGKAFVGEPVGLKPTREEHLFDVYYCHQRLGQIDLRKQAKSKHHYLPIRTPRGKSASTPLSAA